MRVLVLLSLLAAAYAACPNDCSGHGTCNIYSACECYRNWMAADCSERVCYFGHAFIDTPQGDLNADGRVDQFTNTYKIVLGSNRSFWTGQAGLATGSNSMNMLLGRKKLSVREKHGVGFVAGAARTKFAIEATASGVVVNAAVAKGQGSITVDGTSATAVFSVGDTVYNRLGLSVGVLTAVDVGGTTLTFGASTLRAVVDDEPLYAATSVEYILEKNVLTEYTTDTTILTSLNANQDSDIYGYAEACANDSTVDDSSIKYAIEVLVTDSGLAVGNAVGYGTGLGAGMTLVDGDAMGQEIAGVDQQYMGWQQVVCFGEAHSLSEGDSVTQANSGATGIVAYNTCASTIVESRSCSGECADDTQAAVIVITSTVKFDSTNTVETKGMQTSPAYEEPPYNQIDSVTDSDADVNRGIVVCSVTSAVYNTQWATAAQAEAYPTNHAGGCLDCSYPGGGASAAAAATAKAAHDEAHFYRECSNKGLCNRGSGTCECQPGYVGEGCARSACPNDCSGHGVCRRAKDIDANFMGWDAHKTQACVCDAGFEGVDCSQRQCPFGDDPVTRINDLNEIQVFGYAEAGTITDASTQASAAGATGLGLYDTLVQLAEEIPANRDKMYPIQTTSDVACDTKLAVGDEVYDWDGSDGVFICKIASIDKATDNKCDIYCEANMENSGTILAAGNTIYTFPDNGVLCNNALMKPQSAPGTTKNTGVATQALFSLEFQDEFGDKWTTKSINFMSSTVADDVEAALEALPNNVLADVEVSLVNGNVAKTSAAVFGELTRGRYVAVTFLHNSGDLPMLGARYEFTYSPPNWIADGTINLDNVCAHDNLMTTSNNEDGSFDSRGPFQIREATKGNKENVVCSNRGLCDYSTGLCKCFAGFTDFDCSVQNALASS